MNGAADIREEAPGGVSFGREAWRRVWASRAARACLAVLAVFFLAALGGEAANAWFAWRDVTPPWQTQDLAARYLAPCAAHWLGTDGLGRDVLLRLVQRFLCWRIEQGCWINRLDKPSSCTIFSRRMQPPHSPGTNRRKDSKSSAGEIVTADLRVRLALSETVYGKKSPR